MSKMLEEFDEAAARVKNLKSLPSNEELLDLYGYFKQVRPRHVAFV